MKETQYPETDAHPLLPTITLEKMEEQHSSLYSDHLPKVYTAPLANKQNLKILSWNLLDPSQPSGCHPSRSETVNQMKNRANRTVNAIIKTINQQSCDILVFQEFYDIYENKEWVEYLESALKEKLGKQWDFTRLTRENSWGDEITIQKTEFVTCTRKTTVTVVDQNSNDNYDEIINAQVSELTAYGQTFKLYNLHTPHADIPDQGLKDYLERLNAEGNIILCGDTNHRVPPTHFEKQNIVTGAVVISFQQPGKHGDYTDACFYQLANEKEPTQINGHIIDYRTGEIYQSIEASANTWQRLILCVDKHHYAGFKITASEINFTQFETQMSALLGQKNRVKLTSDGNNIRGIGIAIKNTMLSEEYFTTIFKQDNDFRICNEPGVDIQPPQRYLYLPLTKVEELIESIDQYLVKEFNKTHANQSGYASWMLGSYISNYKNQIATMTSIKKISDFCEIHQSSTAATLYKDKRAVYDAVVELKRQLGIDEVSRLSKEFPS